jgi:hypothetical protein
MPEPVRKANLAAALDALVHLYDGWGRPDQAAPWRKERESLQSPAPAEKPNEKSSRVGR